MPANFELQTENMGLVVVSGRLSKAELEAIQSACEAPIQESGRFKLLVILDGFQGWQKSNDWSDMSFAQRNDASIHKIAIVGDSKWEDLVSAFTIEDFRDVKFKFFATGQQAMAWQWLDD